MAGLGSPLAFALGGGGLSQGRPWVTNMLPAPNEDGVKLLRPVRFSLRDAETFIEPSAVLVEAGYASVHSAGTLFDEMPRTKRMSLRDITTKKSPLVTVASGHVDVKKTTDDAERSVWATAIDSTPGYKSVMVSAVIQPLTISPPPDEEQSGPLNHSIFPMQLMPLPYSPDETPINTTGAVLGLEHGPRRTAMYLWLKIDSDNNRIAKFCGPISSDGFPAVVFEVDYNWSGAQRYTIVTNEAQGFVEVYASTNNTTQRIFSVAIADMGTFDDDYVFRAGGDGDVVAVYGQEGPTDDRSRWTNIAVTDNVGFPVLGLIRTGEFRTVMQSAHLVRSTGEMDPQDADVTPWFLLPESYVDDRSGTLIALSGTYRMVKEEVLSQLALYRDEPGILRTTDGFSVQASFDLENMEQQEAITGTGLLVYDGQTVFRLILLDDGVNKNIGIRKRAGTDANFFDYFVPDIPVDWSAGEFRLVVDSRRGKVDLYNVSDLVTPAMSLDLDRTQFPNTDDEGYDGITPFVAFGHITNVTSTTGTFIFKRLEIGPVYQALEGADGDPEAANPAWELINEGTTISFTDDVIHIEADNSQRAIYHREIVFGSALGVAVECRARVLSHRPYTRTGCNILLDDGTKSFQLAFVETLAGKFISVSQRGVADDTLEVAGLDGEQAQFSYAINWTEFHTYRLEVNPNDGFTVYVDDNLEPVITIPRRMFGRFPSEQFSGVTSAAFGQFTQEGAVSEWTCFRTFLTSGFEISFKKNYSDAVLRDQLFGNQALLVVYVEDNDDPSVFPGAPGGHPGGGEGGEGD